MLFNPKCITKSEGSFIFSGDVKACSNVCLDKPVLSDFWRNFSFGTSSLTISHTDEYIFSIGDARRLTLDGYEYSINVEPTGIFIYAETEKDLINGFMTLLDRFKAVEIGDEMRIAVECSEIRDSAEIGNRMIHYCVFAETELFEIERFVRLCGALKYTHIVMEFWGMLKYDCLKELSWPHGFAKEEIKPIIKEANDLGIEVIPMFNHWGHAPAARVMHGKHVVLDQNPALQSYFTEDGWCWDITKPKVKKLLGQIRTELLELCGEGRYFHIGCDEAYNFEFTDENIRHLADFINEINDEMNALGRRIFVWGDMFLYRYAHYNPKNKYTCNAPSVEVEQFFLENLKKNIIIADWQYRVLEAPVETTAVFQNAGFDSLICTWDESRPFIDSALETIKNQSLMGYMHTTWHTLSAGMPYVTLMGVGGFENIKDYKFVAVRPYTAALLRKVMPINGDYEKAGWAKFDIGVKC